MIQMRDKNLNFIQFNESVEKFVGKKLHFPKDRRTAVIDNPTLLEQYSIVLSNKYKDIEAVCIVVHFIPEIALRYRLLLDLEIKLSKFDLKKQLKLKLLLDSRQTCLSFLYETKEVTSYEIFGNILNLGCKLLNNLKLIKRSTKVVKAQRKRGYDDKGSQRPKEKWLETFDVSFTNLQNEKEKKIDLHRKTLDYLIKYLKELKFD